MGSGVVGRGRAVDQDQPHSECCLAGDSTQHVVINKDWHGATIYNT